jgi:predicted dienelactone hydrolase
MKIFSRRSPTILIPSTPLYAVVLGVISSLTITSIVQAAEKIYFNFGTLELSLRVDSLEDYSRQGKINQELAFYFREIPEKQQAQVREFLSQNYELDSIYLYRFFHTPLGEEMLSVMGKLINIEGGLNGKYALRASLLQAATDANGLNLLSAVRKFPNNIELNMEEILAVMKLIQQARNTTREIITEIENLRDLEVAHETSINFHNLSDIRQAGTFQVNHQVLHLQDKQRNRKFYVELYYPPIEGQTPVVIISHSLASRPRDFAKYGKHLASYGYLVAIPQHPGSDFAQIQQMFAGYTRETFGVGEFINRPLDVSYLLDELAILNQTEFKGKLNLDSVGIIGHSLGGYTALALGGAQIDFEHLASNCQADFPQANPSLLLQCRALQLPHQDYHLKDNRIKAIFALNPLNHSVFGEKGLTKITIPVFLSAGSKDVITPAIYEQIPTFSQLKSPDKYLGFIRGDIHIDFSNLDFKTQTMLRSLAGFTPPETEILDSYINAMSLSFFEVYLNHDRNYLPYLQSSYSQYISQKPFDFYLLDSNLAENLNATLVKLQQSTIYAQ